MEHQSHVLVLVARENAHLVTQLLDPLNHFRNGILVHSPSRLADGVYDGKVALQRVQGRDGRLLCVSVLLYQSSNLDSRRSRPAF